MVGYRQRRLGSIEDIVLSLSARGLSHGDIGAQLADVYESEVSKATSSTIDDKAPEGMTEWQSRPWVRSGLQPSLSIPVRSWDAALRAD